MRLRLNIIFSLVAHAAIITIAFTVGRGWTSPAPANPLTVSLVSGATEIKALDARDQIKQQSHSRVSSVLEKAVSGSHDYGAAVKEKAAAEAVRDETHTISSAMDYNTEDRSSKESSDAQIGPPKSLNNTRGVPSPSLATGYQGWPGGITASGGVVHEQIKNQSKGTNTDDGKAIRQAIEKAKIYPLLARKRGLEGTALTEFTVNAKGYPDDIRITESSGYNILDTAAKESLIRAAPFSVGKGRYEISIKFKLNSN